MGIYYDDKFYGVKITTDREVIFPEKMYEQEMTPEEKEEIKRIFNELKQQHNEIYLYVYVSCTCTLESPPATGMVWAGWSVNEL